jgi:hypothetical protein
MHSCRFLVISLIPTFLISFLTVICYKLYVFSQHLFVLQIIEPKMRKVHLLDSLATCQQTLHNERRFAHSLCKLHSKLHYIVLHLVYEHLYTRHFRNEFWSDLHFQQQQSFGLWSFLAALFTHNIFILAIDADWLAWNILVLVSSKLPVRLSVIISNKNGNKIRKVYQ